MNKNEVDIETIRKYRKNHIILLRVIEKLTTLNIDVQKGVALQHHPEVILYDGGTNTW